MAVTTDDLKDYLGLPPDDTTDVSGYLNAARSRARSAGVPDFASNAQYDLFLLGLAAMAYDKRGLTSETNAQQMINSFVLSLRYATEDTQEAGT